MAKSKYVRNALIAALILGAIGLLGMIQGIVLEYDVIETTTTSPDPATAVVWLAGLAMLVCAVAAIIIVLVRRKRRQRLHSD